VLALGNSFTLTVNGTGYNSSSVVQVNGNPRPTTLVSPTQLRAQIPQTDILSIGQRTITVLNPAPGGGTSNATTLTVIGLLGMLDSPEGVNALWIQDPNGPLLLAEVVEPTFPAVL
jgi:hypothetical protein